jgi:hypothetical protein
MRDEPGVQEIADVGGVAAARVLVIVGDEAAKLGGIARLGRGLGARDELADLVLRSAGGAAARTGEQERERECWLMQEAPPTAGCRP